MSTDVRLIAGRYRVDELLGQGGMSDVHRGVDTRLGRTVAIKLLKPPLAQDPAFRIRFRQEAQAAARMTHPTIVRVFDAGEETIYDENGDEEKLPFIVMEYVEGVLLKDLIARGPIDVSESIHIAQGILTALEYSHRAGVVHRDIKPGNVMITASGQVKVMDFGIARAISDSSATMAETTAIIGTASYFSPEQAQGESVDARSDLYSTGVVLFEMLTGKQPFTGETAVSIAYQHVNSDPVAPSTLNAGIPRSMDLIVGCALAKKPTDRYQTAVEFRSDLNDAHEGRAPRHAEALLASQANEVTPTNEESPFESMFVGLTVPENTAPLERKKSSGWIWIGVIVIAVLIIGALFVASRLNFGESKPDSVTIPHLSGVTFAQAKTALSKLDVTWNQANESSSEYASGLVTRTDPTAGTTVATGSTITVYVSSGKPTVTVPDIQNMTVPAATAALKAVGLSVGATTTQNSATVGANVVMASNPTAGQSAPAGSAVAITVSSGNVTVPNVVGQSIAAAQQSLTAVGLVSVPTPDSSCPQNTGAPLVTEQSVAPGDAPQGTSVNLTYCTG